MNYRLSAIIAITDLSHGFIYRDIVLNNTRKTFEFNMTWRMRLPIKTPANLLPIVRNVTIINASGTAETAGDMSGLEGKF